VSAGGMEHNDMTHIEDTYGNDGVVVCVCAMLAIPLELNHSRPVLVTVG